ncbi:Leucyl-tRNA synthetase, partial [Reticulomyxa filosa]
VKSAQDVGKLEEIKDKVYKLGFNFGKLIVGPDEFETKLIKKDMVSRGLAELYWEPEGIVMSRTGVECVVAATDQYYLPYGEPEWQSLVMNHVQKVLQTYNPKTQSEFVYRVNWLKEWACSREFGLGTKLPMDPKFVIESLSDSTIYMAFYTVCHHFLDGELDGSASKNPLKPEWFTPEVWDAIFLAKDVPKHCKISPDLITKMRKEFEYWYPMDLRVSGKDLIPNHLTMCLYNHAAIWKNDPNKWPVSFFTNGHILIDKEKMSKQTGNFLTLFDTIQLYGADATRLALADAGDGLEDANFSKDVANAAVLKLTKLETWMNDAIETTKSQREGSFTNLDKMFDNAINIAIIETDKAYADMQFRHALGFLILKGRGRGGGGGRGEEGEGNLKKIHFSHFYPISTGYFSLENAKNYYVTHVVGGPHKLNNHMIISAPLFAEFSRAKKERERKKT